MDFPTKMPVMVSCHDLFMIDNGEIATVSNHDVDIPMKQLNLYIYLLWTNKSQAVIVHGFS